MASLQLMNRGFQGRVLALRLGVNRVGRHSEADFQIDDPSVSRLHCEIVLRDQELLVRDCGSSNGTFIDGNRIEEEVVLNTGQILRIGEVDCLVADAEIRVSIPVIAPPPQRPPPRILEEGRLSCATHDDAPATYQCTKCQELMCTHCVKRLRRRGGKFLELCSRCSSPVKRIGTEGAKKRSFLDFLKTVKIPFGKRKAEEEPEQRL